MTFQITAPHNSQSSWHYCSIPSIDIIAHTAQASRRVLKEIKLRLFDETYQKNSNIQWQGCRKKNYVPGSLTKVCLLIISLKIAAILSNTVYFTKISEIWKGTCWNNVNFVRIRSRIFSFSRVDWPLVLSRYQKYASTDNGT